MDAPDHSSLSTVFVVGPEEVYAAGHGGSLHALGAHGWTNLLSGGAPISALARWQGALWVATLGDQGLCKWTDGNLKSIKPKLRVTHLDYRAALVFTTTGGIGDTQNGAAFALSPVDDFADIVEDVDPEWE